MAFTVDFVHGVHTVHFILDLSDLKQQVFHISVHCWFCGMAFRNKHINSAEWLPKSYRSFLDFLVLQETTVNLLAIK